MKVSISKVFDYYFRRDKYKADLDRGMKEFLNRDKDSVIFSVDEEIMPYFMEWMLYDFNFRNGRKMIEDYCELNPDKLNMIELAEYKYLTKNTYGFFEIVKVDIGRGVEVRNPLTDENFYVYEVSLTYQVGPGDLIINRVSKIFDHYEFVGSDGFSMGKVRGIENFIPKKGDKLTPKEIYHGLVSPEEKKVEPIKEDNLDDIEKKLAKVLEKSILGKHISLKTIKKWFKDLPDEKSFPRASKIMKMIMDLLLCRRDPEKKYLDEIIELITSISNNTPREDLDGKTPAQKAIEVGDEQGHNVVLSRTSHQAEKIVDDFIKLMNKGEMEEAIEKIGDFFQKAREEYYVSPEIFRIYANLATCYFCLQKDQEGWEALDMSLKLNPKYDFGLDLLKKFKHLEASIKKTARKNKSQAREYYDFLKSLGINYETEKITDSERFNISYLIKKK